MIQTCSLDQWEEVVESLRAELQEYGGLLSLLDEQRRSIVGRDTESLLDRNGEIGLQLKKTHLMRLDREHLSESLARELGLVDIHKLSDMLPFVPEPALPLLRELVDRVNDLLEKIQRKAGQNRMLLSRACEITEEIMRTLQPQSLTKTYNEKGNLSMNSSDLSGNVEFSA